MDYTILVNKDNRLHKNYVPNNLVEIEHIEIEKIEDINLVPKVSYIVFPYFIKMCFAARKEGFNIVINSGYRSYEDQQEIWNYYLEEIGLEETIKRVAPLGASEHQTGLAIDIGFIINGEYVSVEDRVEESKWLQENAHKYGFILRYPKDKEDITGYNYEPWHYRFVGVELATKLYEEDITLEEYYLKDKVEAKAK